MATSVTHSEAARAGRPLYMDTADPAQRAGYLREGLKSKQSHRLRTCDGRDLSVPCFALVLPGRSASHRVRACGSPLFVDSRPGRAHRATLEPARCGFTRHSEHGRGGSKKSNFFNLVFRKRQWKPNLSVVAWHGKNRYMRCT